MDRQEAIRMIGQMASDAIMVQTACNMMGVAASLAENLPKLRKALDVLGENSDTNAINTHPITRMFASALHHHSGMGMSDTKRYDEAYTACCDLAQKPFNE